MDKRDAVAVLLTLHDGGYRLEPAQIYAWALKHGWPSRGAERLQDLATRIRSGTRPRVSTWPLRPDILQRWREQAGGAS